jgi:hypothetical protein
MRTFRFAFSCISVVAGTCFALHGQDTSLGGFSALAGCWERADKSGSVISEMWMKPAGTSMLGVGRTVKGGKTADYEFMRIEQQADGVYYVARPKANTTETAFKLKTASGTDFVFENPEHDFPQRIIYKINGNVLAARIEGTRNGKSMGFDFNMDRVNCN